MRIGFVPNYRDCDSDSNEEDVTSLNSVLVLYFVVLCAEVLSNFSMDDEDEMDLRFMGSLFGDPQNTFGDSRHPYTYVWPCGMGDFDIQYEPSESSRELSEIDEKIDDLRKSNEGKTFSISLPASEHKLMAHYVWESSIKMASFIATGRIKVQGKTVLELGAGGALPSVVSLHMGSKLVVATDYDSPSIVEAMGKNIKDNVDLEKLEASTGTKALVTGHTWATDVTPLLDALKSVDGYEEETSPDG